MQISSPRQRKEQGKRPRSSFDLELYLQNLVLGKVGWRLVIIHIKIGPMMLILNIVVDSHRCPSVAGAVHLYHVSNSFS